MAFQQPRGYNTHSPVLNHDQSQRPIWPQPAPTMQISHGAHARRDSVMDPESEASDVSEDEEYGSPFPINLPSAPSKQSLEIQDVVAQHLAEMERIENHNIRKHKQLRARRAQKDESIMRKRALQDAKIQAIMTARARRDTRIKQRRDREDIAFQQFYDLHEEEENRLRRRLKALKRGLPADEQTSGSRRTSINASPQSFSVVPPPAKRHQSTHPSEVDPRSTPKSHETPSFGQPPPDTPQYQYAPYPQANAPVFSPSVQNTMYQPLQQQHSPAPPNDYRRMPDNRPADFPTAGSAASPHNGDAHSRHPSLHLQHREAAAPHHPSHSYDTRPPPPALHQPAPITHGFAAVNVPSQAGFAAVNPGYIPNAASHQGGNQLHSPSHGLYSDSVDHTPGKGGPAEEKSNNKRAPSTTHPYQMSEAFANRHHHCEDTDSLQRGIWTWYGPNGTQDRPTDTPTKMYLKCNHENCGRIDWRTVHGLQCHIVKNHEQPKGTIGSLEKALAAYGVPVREIEDYEKVHGPGSGGTMADPKSIKLRAKQQQAMRVQSPSNYDRSTPQMEMAPPGLHQTKFSDNVNGVHRPESPMRFEPQVPRSSGFAAVNNGPSRQMTFRPESREAPQPHQFVFQDARRSDGKPVWHSERQEAASSVPAVPGPPPRTSPYDPARESSESNRKIKAQEHASKDSEFRNEHDHRSRQEPNADNKVEHSPQTHIEPPASSTSIVEAKNSDDSTVEETNGRTESTEPKSEEPEADVPKAERSEERIYEHMKEGAAQEQSAEKLICETEVTDKPDLAQVDIDSYEKEAIQSPEGSARRVQPPRRESRRASMAHSRTPRDKYDDADSNTSPGSRPSAKKENIADDNSDMIVVDMEGVKADKEKEEEDEKTKPTTPARRPFRHKGSRRSIR